MRKDKIFGKNLLVYTQYRVSGRNIQSLINACKHRDINLKNIKEINANTFLISIKYCDNSKFFAFTNELCYTIKKEKDYGLMLPLLNATKNLGIVIGALFFAFFCYYCNNFVFDISYVGSGNVYQREIGDYLENKGVKKFSKFSDFNLNELSNCLLKDNDNLTFVSIKKNGNRLEVYSNKKNKKPQEIDKSVFKLYSNVSGIVESINVYRGTAIVNVGDYVENGSLLVDGVVYLKEMANTTNVLANVSVISERKTEIVFDEDNMESIALILAKEQLNKEIVNEKIIKRKEKDKIIYTVILNYRTVIKVG